MDGIAGAVYTRQPMAAHGSAGGTDRRQVGGGGEGSLNREDTNKKGNITEITSTPLFVINNLLRPYDCI